MRIRAGNQLSGDARTLGFPPGWSLTENDGDVEASGGADPLAVALGYVNWNMHVAVGTSPSALTSQTIYATAIYLPPGKTVTGVVLPVNVAASGTKPTGFFVGLASPAVMVAQSADVSAANGVPFATAGVPTQVAFSAPYVTNGTDSPTGLYYVVRLLNGSYGTTQPTFGRTEGLSGIGSALTGKSPVFATAGTGQSALPANAAAVTLTAEANAWVVGVY